MKYIIDNLNNDSEGWVICFLDEDDNLIILLKMKKLPYKVMRTHRELMLKEDVITLDVLQKCKYNFVKIFKTNIGKTNYYGLTKKGQTKWLDSLEMFNIYASEFISDTGEKMQKKHVSINTYYGTMNGYGWFLNELVKKGMPLFHLESDDVDLSFETFKNICEDEQSTTTPINTTVLKGKYLVSSDYTTDQLIQCINKLMKSDKKKEIFTYYYA